MSTVSEAEYCASQAEAVQGTRTRLLERDQEVAAGSAESFAASNGPHSDLEPDRVGVQLEETVGKGLDGRELDVCAHE